MPPLHPLIVSFSDAFGLHYLFAGGASEKSSLLFRQMQGKARRTLQLQLGRSSEATAFAILDILLFTLFVVYDEPLLFFGYFILLPPIRFRFGFFGSPPCLLPSSSMSLQAPFVEEKREERGVVGGSTTHDPTIVMWGGARDKRRGHHPSRSKIKARRGFVSVMIDFYASLVLSI